MTRAEDKARILVDLLAKDLQEHLAIIAVLRELSIRVREALPSSQRNLELVSQHLTSLGLLRASMIEKMEMLVDLVRDHSLPADVVRDIYALSGYFVEAGSKSEEEVLKRLLGFGATEEELVSLERLKAIARLLYGISSEKYRERRG